MNPTRSSRVLVTLLVLGGCATNPVTGAREFVMLSEAQEIAMGREADVEVRRQMGLYEDDALQRYVEEIGLALAPPRVALEFRHRRLAGDQRVRRSGRVHLPHTWHHAVS